MSHGYLLLHFVVQTGQLGRTLLRVAFEAEDFLLGFQPVVERMVLSIATFGMELIGPLRDADVEIVTR